MNSMITQIERQFNIPTSLVGFINGSFEIGNELFLHYFSLYFILSIKLVRILFSLFAVLGHLI